MPLPLNDDALADFLQGWFAGLTGLDGTLVRPRWQLDPPQQPSRNITWMALGIKRRRRDFDIYKMHVGGNDQLDPPVAGYDITYRNEILEILCSVYGPYSDAIADLVWNGVAMSQNREALFGAGMGLIKVEDPYQVPELIKEKWLRRIDFEVHLRRAVSLQYPVLDIASATVEIISDTPSFTDTITVPVP